MRKDGAMVQSALLVGPACGQRLKRLGFDLDVWIHAVRAYAAKRDAKTREIA